VAPSARAAVVAMIILRIPILLFLGLPLIGRTRALSRFERSGFGGENAVSY
jgi:hypothetical protein